MFFQQNRIHRDAEYYSEESDVNLNKLDVPFSKGYNTQLPGTSLYTTVSMEHYCGKYCKIHLKIPF